MTPDNTGSHSHRVTLDRVFSVLSHPTRRRILSTLAEHGPGVDDAFDTDAFAPEGEDLVLFRQELHHQHFPHLADAGFIEWNKRTDTVTRGPRFESIEPLLGLLADHAEELPGDWPVDDEAE